MNEILHIRYPTTKEVDNLDALATTYLSEENIILSDLLNGEKELRCGCFFAAKLCSLLVLDYPHRQKFSLLWEQISPASTEPDSLFGYILGCRYVGPPGKLVVILQNHGILLVQGCWVFPANEEEGLYAVLGFNNCMEIVKLDEFKRKMAKMWEEIISSQASEWDSGIAAVNWAALKAELEPLGGLECLARPENWHMHTLKKAVFEPARGVAKLKWFE